jgi:hypothetical protein
MLAESTVGVGNSSLAVTNHPRPQMSLQMASWVIDLVDLNIELEPNQRQAKHHIKEIRLLRFIV